MRSHVWLLVAALAATDVAAQTLGLALGDIAGDGWRAESVEIALAGGGARLSARSLDALGRRFEAVRVDCARFAIDPQAWRCSGGRLAGLEDMRIEASWSPRTRTLDLTLAAADETWHLVARDGAYRLELGGARLERVAPWLHGDLKPAAGRADGSLDHDGTRLSARVTVRDAGFADASGLVAGEKLAASLTLEAARDGPAWRWQGTLGWDAGALLVDPLYVADGGWRFEARGHLDQGLLDIETATLSARGIGSLRGTARVDLGTRRVPHWQVAADALELAGLRSLLPAAWLDLQRLADLELAGRASIAATGRDADIDTLALTLVDAGAQSAARALGIAGLNLDLAIAPGRTLPFRLAFRRAYLHALELGPAEAEGETGPGGLVIPHLVIPLLDGVLALHEITLARPDGHWQAGLRGAFTPLAMPRLTAALGWPPLAGSISGVLPRMRYVESEGRSTFSVDGALMFEVFGGAARVDGIRIDNPFGRTPRLAADLGLTGLDLATLTGAVKFGSITGLVDVSVKGLEMENWQPLAFDARIVTAAGDFPRRISQRAVQNISSIGGAGAGAAIQASFLRFFETFGYRRIGLSCRLVAGICEMGGLTAGRDGGYVMVEGGGLPALNVVGYNRFVGWNEMLERMRAIIEGNSTMVVQ